MRSIVYDSENEEKHEKLRQTIAGLVHIYEKKHPGQSIQTFTVNLVHISLTNDEQGYKTTAHNLFEIEIGQ